MKIIISIIFSLFLLLPVFAQKDERDREWNTPVEPFKIIGNVYYVGAAEITSFLIATPEGHILIDGGYEETAPQILANLKKLGFKPEDVKILLNTQAHYDHAGGLAGLKRATGARLFASSEDAVLIENGGLNDFQFGDRFPYEKVKVDKLLKDGEKIKIGGVSLKTIFTPGHTKGCTSFIFETEENGKKYSVLFVGSTTAPGYDLVSSEKYPQIVADYEKTFARLKKLKPDVFLASHGNFFDLQGKTEKLRRAALPNPFIETETYRKFLESTEQQFREKLKTQRAGKQ